MSIIRSCFPVIICIPAVDAAFAKIRKSAGKREIRRAEIIRFKTVSSAF